MSIKGALVKLKKLLQSWGLSEEDYVLVDEFAYLLQGYNLEGPEIKNNHLDLYVFPDNLPWKVRPERSTFPPFDSKYSRQYEEFMKDIGFALDLLVADALILDSDRIHYKLPNSETFPLMELVDMTEQFVHHTLLHYSLEDVGEDKIKEWYKKLRKIQSLAREKQNKKLIDVTDGLAPEALAKWQEIF